MASRPVAPGLSFAVGLLVVALAASAVGCGNDGESGAAPVATQAQFIRQAAAVCAEERANLDAEIAKFRSYPTSKRKPAPLLHGDVAHFVILPVIEEEINGIEELRIPPGDEKRIDALLSAETFAIDETALTERFPSMAAVRRNFVDSDKLLREYGLDACTNGPGSPR